MFLSKILPWKLRFQKKIKKKFTNLQVLQSLQISLILQIL